MMPTWSDSTTGLGIAHAPAAAAVLATPGAAAQHPLAAGGAGASHDSEPFIRKFCRTRHLHNLGSASRDDLIMDAAAQAAVSQSLCQQG